MNGKIIASVLIMLVMVFGVFASYSIAKSDDEIDSYEDCVEAGYPVQETAPLRCMTSDGVTFVQGKDKPKLRDAIKDKFTKFVYGTGNVPQISKAHCTSVGGTFNTCGSLCSDGEVCVKVCALTCENVPITSDSSSEFKIKEKNGNVEIEYKSEDSKYKMKYKDGSEYEFESKLKIKNMMENEIEFEDSDGVVGNVKVLPQEAIEKAFSTEAGDVKIKLEEKSYNNVPKVIYKVDGDSNGKFLGIFKMKARYQAEIDANTGDVLGWNGPWWAFMITGEPNKPIIKDNSKVNDFYSCVKVTGISTDGIPSECTYEGVTYAEKIKDKSGKVTDFKSCVDAGYPVQETAPPRCRDSKGNTYVDFDDADKDYNNCVSKGGEVTQKQVVCVQAPCYPIITCTIEGKTYLRTLFLEK